MQGELRRDVPDLNFHVWLSPLELVDLQGETLFVRAPDHIRSCVRDRYLPLVREAAARGFAAGALVEIVDDRWREERPTGTCHTRTPADGLNPKYTFEHFVIGAGNRFAHATALKVAELPGQAFNPLFIHGRPGLGKTHLLHAIGNYVLRYGSGLAVRYSTGEEFTSEFVRALQVKDIGAFKERFRGVDVLLLDDVQFVADKARTEEELFHTFNVLRESGRQLVMTSDRGPDELAGLQERLAERFACGVVAALEAPDLPARRAILQKRALVDSVDASSALVEAIAERIDGSVRALEAALIQVVAQASVRGERPTPELAEHLLGSSSSVCENSSCTVQEIVDVTATRFGLSPSNLMDRDRRPAVTRARKLAMYLSRELTEQSLPAIGRAFGGRDHSTVLSAIRRVEDDISVDPQLAGAVESLRQALGRRG
ncbi:MAG: chromosomal replication initiator protein DnaA [Actinomycetota bacterium]|nr:chromosomal replication initiator protein DnaA [Actinomycetota bacterium]